MAFSTPAFGTSVFTGFGQQQAAPAFPWPASSSSVPAAPPQQTPAEKGQIIACLTESKNVQLSILQELQAMNAKLSGAAPAVSLFAPAKPPHYGITCDICHKKDITGARYKCLFCKDFDMCEECEARPFTTSHDASHVFVKIKDTPAFFAVMAKNPALFTL
jgi:hypothetical protein